MYYYFSLFLEKLCNVIIFAKCNILLYHRFKLSDKFTLEAVLIRLIPQIDIASAPILWLNEVTREYAELPPGSKCM